MPKSTNNNNNNNKKDKLDFMKMKKIYSLKDTIKKAKRQTTEWEKVYVNHISDKALVLRI